jgi:hypothetical protein
MRMKVSFEIKEREELRFEIFEFDSVFHFDAAAAEKRSLDFHQNG